MDTAKAISPVEEAINKIKDGQNEVFSLLSDLEARLNPILLSPSPEAAQKEQAVVRSLSDISIKLLNMGDLEYMAVRKLRDIISRLDI